MKVLPMTPEEPIAKLKDASGDAPLIFVTENGPINADIM